MFDPADVLNPGVLVRPAPLDDDVRMAAAPVVSRDTRPTLALAYRHDGGDLSAAVHRCTGVGQVPGRPAVLRRGHVPLLAGDAGGEGLDPRPGPGAAGDAGARRPGHRLALARGARRARPVPVVQGLLLGLPDRRGHGHLQGRGAAPVLPPAAAPPPALHARLAAALGRPRRPGAAGWSTPSSARGWAAGWPSGAPAWTSAARCRRSPSAPSASSGPTARRRPTTAPRWRCGWTRSPTTSTPTSPWRPRRCWRRRATACRCRAPTPAAG